MTLVSAWHERVRGAEELLATESLFFNLAQCLSQVPRDLQRMVGAVGVRTRTQVCAGSLNPGTAAAARVWCDGYRGPASCCIDHAHPRVDERAGGARRGSEGIPPSASQRQWRACCRSKRR